MLWDALRFSKILQNDPGCAGMLRDALGDALGSCRMLGVNLRCSRMLWDAPGCCRMLGDALRCAGMLRVTWGSMGMLRDAPGCCRTLGDVLRC